MANRSNFKIVYSTGLIIISLLTILSFSFLEPLMPHDANTTKITKKKAAERAIGEKTDSTLRVLLFSGTGWYRHPGIPVINGWLVRTGVQHGMLIDVSETGRDISEESLEQYDVLILNNANVLEKVLNEEQRKAIEDWYSAGGGIVALHAVLVHQDGWPWIMDLGGCDFNSDSEF